MSTRELIGQETLLLQVKDWLSARRGQSLLLSGARGTGKHHLAEQLAAALLCEEPGVTEPCGQCQACRCVSARTHPDWICLDAEEGASIKIDRLRTAVLADFLRSPQLSRVKVYQIEADALSETAQNLLLKSVEEAPDFVVLILLCQQVESVLLTLRSRVIHWRLRPLSLSQLERALENRGIQEERLDLLASYSGGSLGQALELLEGDKLGDLDSLCRTTLFHCATWPLWRLLSEQVSLILERREWFSDFLSGMELMLRDLMCLAVAPATMSEVRKKRYQDFRVDLISPEGFKRTQDWIERIRKGQGVHLNVELSIVQLLLNLHKELGRCQK